MDPEAITTVANQALNTSANTTIMGIAIRDVSIPWAVASIILAILGAMVARSVMQWLKVKAAETETHLDDIIVAAIGTPLQVTIVALGANAALWFLGIFPLRVEGKLDDQLFMSFWVVMAAWIISSFLHDVILTYGHDWAENSESEWDDRLIELLELVVKYIVWFAALMAILKIFEIDITPFLAGAGIAGLAIALAAQDIISNFFGGAIITIDKPFKVGDRIKIDANYGDVISVGARSTRIRTLDYQIVTIPNNKITTNVIVNYSEPDVKLRIPITVTVAYGSDTEKVKRILLEIAKDAIRRTDFILEDPVPKVFFLEFGESALKFILYVWAKKYNLPDEVKDAINTQIAIRFAEEGIEIPFPQMEVRLRKD